MSAPAAKSDRSAASPEEFSRDMAAAKEAGRQIAQNDRLNLRQRRVVVRAIKEQLVPPGPRGRRDTERITRAYQDWRAGVHGTALYEKHISRFARLGYYAREVKKHRLMSAIKKRHRREEKARTKAQAVSETKSEAISATESLAD